MATTKLGELNARAIAYMRARMAMRDPATDQEQNWILAHLVGFALSEQRKARNAEALADAKPESEGAQKETL